MPSKTDKPKMSPNLMLALTGYRQVKNTERLLEQRETALRTYVNSLDDADFAEYIRQTTEDTRQTPEA